MDAADKPRPRMSRRKMPISFRRLLAATGIAVLAGVVLFVGMHAYQARQYENLYRQDHTSPQGVPEYRCGLPGTDQSWLVTRDGGESYERTMFPGNEPLLSSGMDGRYMLGLTPYIYRDAEVDDFAFQVSQGEQDSVGLVLHANPSTGDMFVFSVSKRRHSWWFKRHLHGVWTDLQPESETDYITQQPDTDNLLVAIMRGDQYILFINNHLVGAFGDSTLPSGHVGVYVNDGRAAGNFTCFEVYATP